MATLPREGNRKDKFHVFFDKETGNTDLNDRLHKILNEIRLKGTRLQVIRAVGVVRSFQLQLNYAKKHAKDLVPEITRDIEDTIARIQIPRKEYRIKAKA